MAGDASVVDRRDSLKGMTKQPSPYVVSIKHIKSVVNHLVDIDSSSLSRPTLTVW